MIAHSNYDTVAVQIGDNTVVFHDTDHSSTLATGDSAVVLVGRSLSDIHANNIIV
jgi:hypothetical protein